MTGEAVTAAANGELHAGLACKRDDVRDVGLVRGPDDDRWPAVEPTVEDGARLVVPGIIGCDDPGVQDGAELRERDSLWDRGPCNRIDV